MVVNRCRRTNYWRTTGLRSDDAAQDRTGMSTVAFNENSPPVSNRLRPDLIPCEDPSPSAENAEALSTG
jgi:hypothetical protein